MPPRSCAAFLIRCGGRRSSDRTLVALKTDFAGSKHLAILETRTTLWQDEAACSLTAQVIASRPAIRNAYVELRGPLGAGKTTFVRHLLHALGVTGRVKSPTYAVMEPYELPSPLDAGGVPSNAWHFDFYRFNDPREWEDAGFRDIFAAPGLKLAEWPEQAAGLAPEPDLRIDIRPSSLDRADAADDERAATFSALSPLGLELLAMSARRSSPLPKADRRRALKALGSTALLLGGAQIAPRRRHRVGARVAVRRITRA